MKDKLVIIGAGEFQNPLILKAKEMGLETHVFAWQSGDVGEKSADYFYPVSIVEKEKILEICKDINPRGITSIGSDLATITVNYVARNLGLVCNPPENDCCSTNKYLMREAMKRAGARTPMFIKLDAQDSKDIPDEMKYPVIVKPTDRSGSRAVSKVFNYKELRTAVEAAAAESFEKRAICESIIEGEEFSCECISYKGEHHILAFTKKYTTGAPHYIETGHIEPALISNDILKDVKKEIFICLDALNVTYGASHSEFKIDSDGKARIIEVGARMGGDCIGSDLVWLSTGYDFMRMVIDIACGKEPIIKREEKEDIAFIRFIFNDYDQQMIEEFLNNEPVTCIRKEVKTIGKTPVKDSSTRFGYYIMKSNERVCVEKLFGNK